VTQRVHLRRTFAASVLAALALVVTASACAPTKKGPPSPRIMLVGDSVADSVAPELEAAFDARGRVFQPAAVKGCAVVRGLVAILDGQQLPWAQACEPAVGNMHQEAVNAFRPTYV
jgi:hypothetical protein